MARKAKQEPKPPEVDAALTLVGQAGEPLAVFSAPVVRPLRHMVTLLAASGALPPRLALVSALREEGVTYTALALATILAHDMAGAVGLVELNWEAPGLARLIASAAGAKSPAAGDAAAAGAPAADTAAAEASGAAQGVTGAEGGLAAVLTGRATLDDVLVWTGMPNLALLPAGELPRVGREALVRSARLREIIEELAGRFDHLLLDIPAVAATSDAIPLARLGDAILLVIRQGITSRRVVAATLDDFSQCTVLGVVLNRVKVATPAWIFKLLPQD